jgi:diguanylate cyclase (GGDEF)-like protein
MSTKPLSAKLGRRRISKVAAREDVSNDIIRAKALDLRNSRLETALDNMSQGLCMYDRDKVLIVSNRRYAEMYNLAPAAINPGMKLHEVIALRIAAGNVPVDKINGFDQKSRFKLQNGGVAFDVELEDGRVISIRHQDMADGGYVATHEDITEQRAHQARIQHLARHDPLTDLPNRTLFRDRLEQIETRTRGGEIVAALCIDLDHFKSVNDTLGHAVGDIVLKAAAERLLGCARDSDLVARIGGDEFAILASRLERPEDAAILAEQIVKKVAEPLEIESHRVIIGASVGIAVAPIDAEDGETLMKQADLALYRAKSAGRGAYHFYEQGLDAALRKRHAIETGLRNALLRKEFVLLFQPLFDLTTSGVCSCEALLRWRHPEHGLVAPAEFIGRAEETGLIAPIGRWVLHEALRTAATWPDQIGVAINLSPAQFQKNCDLVDQIRAALDASGIKPCRLELEITESVFLANNELTMETLGRLKAMGVRIALDDFGTGYSSLSYLQRFPFDKLKIDRSFVHDSANGAGGLAIVKAVASLGQSLGMATTAEGVETEAQLDVVRALGCTEAQGYLFSLPLPANAATEFIGLFSTAISANSTSRLRPASSKAPWRRSRVCG